MDPWFRQSFVGEAFPDDSVEQIAVHVAYGDDPRVFRLGITRNMVLTL